MVDRGGKVAAWFTGVSAGSATLAALISAAATGPLHGWLRILFLALLVIAAVSFGLLLLTGLPAVWAAWRGRKHAGPSQPDLAARAEALSRDLNDFLADRERDQPQIDPLWVTDTISEEDRQRRWAARTERITAFGTETMTRYRQRFAVRVHTVFDDAVAAGLEAEQDRWLVRHPVNWLMIAEIAERVGAIAHRARHG